MEGLLSTGLLVPSIFTTNVFLSPLFNKFIYCSQLPYCNAWLPPVTRRITLNSMAVDLVCH